MLHSQRAKPRLRKALPIISRKKFNKKTDFSSHTHSTRGCLDYRLCLAYSRVIWYQIWKAVCMSSWIQLRWRRFQWRRWKWNGIEARKWKLYSIEKKKIRLQTIWRRIKLDAVSAQRKTRLVGLNGKLITERWSETFNKKKRTKLNPWLCSWIPRLKRLHNNAIHGQFNLDE